MKQKFFFLLTVLIKDTNLKLKKNKNISKIKSEILEKKRQDENKPEDLDLLGL
jgi:hypothetical protein